MPKYKVLVGLDYPPGKRAEAGDVVDDLPGKSIKWLRDEGIIEPVDEPAAKGKPAKTPEPDEADPQAEEV